MEDGALEGVVQQARSGEPDAFAELYRLYASRVRGLCRYLLGSATAAEDATSEVFLRVQRAMNTYDPTIPFQRWLLSIASHYCIDQLRRGRLEQRLFQAEDPEASEPAAPGEASPLRDVLAAEERERVRAAIEALAPKYRSVLALRYYLELDYNQIATELGLTRSHVAILLFRAKKELRRVMEHEPGGRSAWIA
jgi:RNA polymerase sigma-70 factor (ECF subfamily)